jgi:hypothetical protein
VHLYRVEVRQHAVPAEYLDKSRTDADHDQREQDQACDSESWSSPRDDRLPRRQQHNSKPEQTMRNGGSSGGPRSAGGERKATGQRGSNEDDE